MNARTLTLLGLGVLAVGEAVAPAQPGPVPVPSQGPPGGVAGFGAPRTPAEMLALQVGAGQPIPAPVVAAKFLAPKDVRVTAYPGTAFSRIYDTPAVLGLRPGYVYRFELSNL